MCARPKESVHNSQYVNLVHILQWQCNDIISIDGTITNVIVYRVHSGRVLAGINCDGIVQYEVIYQLIEIPMSLDQNGAHWFKFCCYRIPAMFRELYRSYSIYAVEYNIIYFVSHRFVQYF